MSESSQPPLEQLRPATTITTGSIDPHKPPRSKTLINARGYRHEGSCFPHYVTRSNTKALQGRGISISAQPLAQQSEFSLPMKNVTAAHKTCSPAHVQVPSGDGLMPPSAGEERKYPGSSTTTSAIIPYNASAWEFNSSAVSLDPTLAPSGSTHRPVTDAMAQFAASKISPSGENWAGGRPRARLRLSLENRRTLPVSQLEVTSGGAAAPLRYLSSSPQTSPPFVGLANLGETCYINVVVQALVACSRAMKLSTERSRACDAERVAERDIIYRESVLAAASPHGSGGEPGVVPCSAAVIDGGSLRIDQAKWAGFAIDQSESVLIAVDSLISEVDERNRALLAGDLESRALQVTAWRTCTIQTTDRKGFLTPGVQPRLELPPERPLTPTSGDTDMDAVVPETLVRLVRECCLSARCSSGDSNAPCAGGVEGVSTNFGFGQQCASELLGKFLDLGASRVDGKVHSTTTRLSEGFRGSVCTRTLCVECERDRVDRDTFMELVLPPHLPRPSDSNHKPHEPPAARSTSSPESITLAELVEATLGSESLVGNNKLWCRFCRQQTEAERRSTLHCCPRLLAIHLRPEVDGMSIGRAESAWTSALGPHKVVRGGGNCCARGGSALIERVMTIQGIAKCQFHDAMRDRAAASHTDYAHGVTGDEPRSKRKGVFQLPNPEPSGEVVYDLVGIILHQGRSLRSGHYTFVRHVIQDRVPGGSKNITDAGTLRHRVMKAEKTQSCSFQAFQGQDVQEKDQSLLPLDGNLVIFDDASVRWLSPEEERFILNCGGSPRGFGDAFLVFYMRRDC